ncbi:MAG: nidogen-like domain-containing protein [Sandaracinaceae bacterium]
MSRRSLTLALLLLFPSSALAQAPLLDSFGGTEGFGTDCLSSNDDGSSQEIDIRLAFPGGLEFFGERHETMFVNTNGNITFNGALSRFTPSSFPIADQPMIAPYWGDVDIRGSEGCEGFGGDRGCNNPSENGVWWHLEPGRVIVTWDQVGHFNCEDGEKMSFQLILTEARYCGVEGDFDVEFRYNRCEWEAGGASGDSNDDGICNASESTCTPAQVGFDAGNLTDFVSVPGSMMTGIHTQMCTMSNIGSPGVWRFQIRAGEVSCPDAGELCDTGADGICGEGRTQCQGDGTVCEQVLEPTTESCNGADDDCDGTTDEGDLCEGENVCDRGNCIPPCFEGGCPVGEACSEAGACVELACADVECAPGERCVGGTCFSACDDSVVCPSGQTCRFGRCQDLCETLECDACSVCNQGACRIHCIATGCPDGQTCEETGECVPDDCLGVRCGPARECFEGVCVDACRGVICPAGELCRMGDCIPANSFDAGPLDDAGVPPWLLDGGGGSDGGGGMDGGVLPGTDGGTIVDPSDEGCGCRAAGAPRSGTPLLLLVGLTGLVALRRRVR